MIVAFLGCDADVLSLAKFLADDEQFTLAEAFVDGPWREELDELCEHVHRADQWPALLGAIGVDLVIVGRDRGEAAGPEPLRRLAQLGISLVLPHPVGGPLLALELDMIRQDSGAPLIPFYPGCRHPILSALRESACGPVSPVGKIEQLVFERPMRDRDRQSVSARLVQDLGLMQTILGPLNKVTAQGPAPDSEAWHNLNVQLAGAGPVLARWSVEPITNVTMGRITLVGAHGKILLEMPDDLRRWCLRVQPADGQARRDAGGLVRDSAEVTDGEMRFEQWDESVGVVQAIESVMRGEPSGPTWLSACRELELVDAVDVSLRKQRLIELHHETVTEQDTFKGLMSAVGCLMLLLVPAVLIGAAIVEGLTADPTTTIQGEPIAAPAGSFRRFWPILLAAPLVGFLLLQTLRLVFPAKPGRSDHDATGSARKS